MKSGAVIVVWNRKRAGIIAGGRVGLGASAQPMRRALRLDVLRHPQRQILPVECGRHEVREVVGGAGECRDAEARQVFGVGFVVERRAVVVERQQHDELHAAGDEFGHALPHPLRVAAFFEVGNEDEGGVGRAGDLALAVGERLVDVGAAAQLDAKEQLYRVVDLVAEIHHRGVEDDHAGAQRGQAGQYRAEDAGVDDRCAHRAALVEAEDEVTHGFAFAPVADAHFRDDALVFGLVVFQVFLDGAVPVDFAETRVAGAGGAVQRAEDGLLGRRLQFLHEFVHDFLHDLPREGPVFFGDDVAQAHQGGDEVYVRGDVRQHFFFGEQCFEVQPLYRVFLHDLYDALREVFADVAQPGADFGRRGAEAAAAFVLWRGFVEGGKGFVHADFGIAQVAGAAVFGVCAEDEAPAFLVFGGGKHFC